jgi:hypothetical protein
MKGQERDSMRLMMTRRHGFVMVVAALLFGWTVTAGAAPPKPPPGAKQQFPATGQTTSYTAGDDGAIEAG